MYETVYCEPSLMSAIRCLEAGWIGRDAILMAGINAVIYLLSTVPTWFLVDRWGRRAILLSGGSVVRNIMDLSWTVYFNGNYRWL